MRGAGNISKETEVVFKSLPGPLEEDLGELREDAPGGEAMIDV